MSTEPEFGDRALLDELAELLRGRNEPPPEVLHAAREAFIWRTVDAEIAALTYDSLLDDAPAGVRAAAQPRILTFEADGLTIEVELDATPSGRRLLGQVVPPQPATLELHVGGVEPGVGAEVVTAEADALGRFVLPLPDRHRRAHLRLRLPGGTSVDCSAVVL